MVAFFYNFIKEQAGKESSNVGSKYFKITVNFDINSGTSFDPDWPNFKTYMQKLFKNALITLDKIKKLLDISNSTDFSS